MYCRRDKPTDLVSPDILLEREVCNCCVTHLAHGFPFGGRSDDALT